jgi:hypothetical protein
MLARRMPAGCVGRLTGEQPAATVSAFLQAADLAISTTPWALSGKSGAVAAALEHGLPVLVTRRAWSLRGMPTPEPDPHPLLFPAVGRLPPLQALLLRDRTSRSWRAGFGSVADTLSAAVMEV